MHEKYQLELTEEEASVLQSALSVLLTERSSNDWRRPVAHSLYDRVGEIAAYSLPF